MSGMSSATNQWVTKTCVYCGREFECLHNTKGRGCSGSCRAMFRRTAGWTANHDALVVAIHHDDFSYREMAYMMDLSRRRIRTIISRLIVQKKSNCWGGMHWSSPEEGVLRDLFPLMSSREVAQLLGRSQKSVDHHARKLHLSKSLTYLIEINSVYLALPQEVRELITLTRRLDRKLSEKHL